MAGPRRGDPRFRIDPRFRQRRIEVKREAGRKRLRVLIAGTSVLVALAAALGAARSPLLAVRHVRVAGTAHVPAVDVVAASGLAGRHQLLDVNARAVARRIELLPWVATATVRREWPTTVRVAVTERVPVATVGSGAGPMAVDGTGRVLAVAPDLRVPVLEPAPGVVPPVVPAPGATVDRFFGPGLAVAAAMPADLAPRVQAIVVGSADDVHLRLESGQDVILGSAADMGPKLTAVLTLEVRQKLGPGTLDVTVPSAPVLTPPPPVGNFSTRTGG
ncbi:MAG: hypothetical protein NVSMB12_07210 [Acidimicrobiales bacterium]